MLLAGIHFFLMDSRYFPSGNSGMTIHDSVVDYIRPKTETHPDMIAHSPKIVNCERRIVNAECSLYTFE